MPSSIRIPNFAPAIALLFLAACGGKTSGVYPGGSSGGASGGSTGSSSGESSSGGGSGGSSGTTSGSTSSGGGSTSSSGSILCVDINPASFDQSCNQDSDCVGIASGTFCSGDCSCPDATINASAYPRYQAETSSIMPGLCGCPAEQAPVCSQHMCVRCDQGFNNPPECEGPDAGVGIEASTGACVNIDVSTYDQSCQNDSDCVEITAGQICTDSCLCGGATINASGAPRYNAAIASIGNTLACPCADRGHPVCAPGATPGAKATCSLCPLGVNCISVSLDGG